MTGRRLAGLTALAATLAWNTAAQPLVVTGTGDPQVDVPAVQAAVDQGGHISLKGHFSFDQPPTTPAGATYSRMVTVSRNVVISGAPDETGEAPTINGGTWPFFIDARGAHVTIEGIRFTHPMAGAVWVYAVSGLRIANCRIENVSPTAEFGMQANQTVPLSGGITVNADPAPPNAARPGSPANFSGTLVVVNNDIDMGAIPGQLSLGIVFFAVGKSPDQEVDIYVTGNTIRNVTEPAINFRVIGGRVHIERNLIVTGSIASANPDAIRVVGIGSFLIARNSIDCGWTEPSATGIDAFSQAAPNAPEASAIIADNDVTMSAPEGTAFGPNSAAIAIKGPSLGNMVMNNRLRGSATAALSVIRSNGGTPASTSFVTNDLEGFRSSLADVFIDSGAADTLVAGRQRAVEDHGTGTVVVQRQ